MLHTIRQFIRWLLQLAAGIVIALALLVGIARLLLPEVASFSADIKAAVKNATGYQLDFDLLSAGMSLYGPELRLTVADVRWPDDAEVLRAEQIAVSLDVVAMITSGRLVPRRILLRGSSANIELDPDGRLLVQGRPLTDYTRGDEPFDPNQLPNLRLHFESFGFTFNDRRGERPSLDGEIKELIAQLDDGRVEVQGQILPGPLFGRRIDLRGEVPIDLLVAEREVAADVPWNVSLAVKDYRLDAWLALLRAQDLPIINSSGSADAAFNFVGGSLSALQADLDLTRIELPRGQAATAVIEALNGRISWRTTPSGWRAEAANLSLERNGASWPRSNISLSFGELAEQQQVTVEADFLRIEDLEPFVAALANPQLEELGLTGQPQGDVRNLKAGFTRSAERFDAFELNGEFARLGYISQLQGIEVSGFTGSVAADQTGGSLELDTSDAVFRVGDWFREPLPIKQLNTMAIWRASEQGYRVLANRILVETDEGQGEASIELTTDREFANPIIDLRATAALRDVSNADRYLPKKIPAKVLDWLDSALGAGEVPDAQFLLTGPLKKFPFRDGDGEFRITADFANASLRYAPDWPPVTDASGTLVFAGPGMYSTENRATVAGVEVVNSQARIADFKQGIVEISANTDTTLAAVLGFLQQSPVRNFTGPLLDDVKVAGPATGEIDLRLPIRDLSAWSLQGYLDTRDAEVTLAGLDFAFTDARARATIDKTRVTVADATATLFDAPVNIAVTPVPVDEVSGGAHRAEVTGVFDIPTVAEAFTIPLRNYLSGTARATGTAILKPAGEESREPFQVVIASDLVGVQSDLPYPLDKAVMDDETLSMQLEFPANGVIDLGGQLERGINWQLRLIAGELGWNVDRGVIDRGAVSVELPAEPGLLVTGYVDTLRLEDWLGLEISQPDKVQPGAGGSRWQDAFRLADLRINNVYALGFRFADVGAQIRFEPEQWNIALTGPWLEGNVRVPYELTATAPMVLDMQRLLLIEPENGTATQDAEMDVDPRELPAVRAEIADFAIDTLRLGQLSADIAKVPDGLQSRRLETTAPSFTTSSSADWLVVDSAQRSRLRFELTSQDVAATWRRLGQVAGITGDSATINANLLWEGGPSLGLLYESTGELDFDIRNGRISNVEAGGGRLIGLFSLAYLPRRLSLDFTDITSEGLEFYSLSGAFRMDFGNAWTCNMGLISEIADVAMIGRAGLLAEDYDQLAVVRPHVSSMLPLPAVVLGGPTVGMATLLISQLFKEPLSDIGETYYSILGPWDDPLFERQTRSQIDTAAFADCEQGLPNLSPEEIAALEEFLGMQADKIEPVEGSVPIEAPVEPQS